MREVGRRGGEGEGEEEKGKRGAVVVGGVRKMLKSGKQRDGGKATKKFERSSRESYDVVMNTQDVSRVTCKGASIQS